MNLNVTDTAPYIIKITCQGQTEDYLSFPNKEDAHAVANVLDMTSSIFAYDEGLEDNTYLNNSIHRAKEHSSLTEKQLRKSAEDFFKYLTKNFTTKYAGTDSEGVWYNSIVRK